MVDLQGRPLVGIKSAVWNRVIGSLYWGINCKWRHTLRYQIKYSNYSAIIVTLHTFLKRMVTL